MLNIAGVSQSAQEAGAAARSGALGSASGAARSGPGELSVALLGQFVTAMRAA